MSKLFICRRIFSNNEFLNGGILVDKEGKIADIFETTNRVQDYLNSTKQTEPVDVFDFGDLVLMPGLIDSHVHINEPGRTEWEGFETATKAAAAGGFTTIVDMPLNSLPPTTTVENLLVKQEATQGKLYTDIGFWGGIIPGNERELKPMLSHGVVGFKCFLCPSGVEEFPNVDVADVEAAYDELKNTNALIAFHAEVCSGCNGINKTDSPEVEDPRKYKTYLKTRSPQLEVNALKLVSKIAARFDGTRTHIVHLSAAEALPAVRELRERIGQRLTVETCHHYLSLCAEDVPDARVEFKCCPPIRSNENREKLWMALKDGDIDLVVSDHSPSTAEMKLIGSSDEGNFLKAWGGVASVQFGLSLFHTFSQKRGFTMADMIRLMCEAPAKLCGFNDRKGKIAVGFDADFCVWNPDEEFDVTPDIIHFRNKTNPYMKKTLRGVVHTTIVRGNISFVRKNNFSAVGKIVRSMKLA